MSTTGSDLAIDAFLSLPPEIADRCELHLAAYRRDSPKIDDPRIITYDWIEREEVGDFLRELDVMLTLSRDLGCMMETFCQTMVQGMLCELPQITTPLDIFVEKLDTGGGIVTSGLDELVEAMSRLATDREKRLEMGRIAARTAKDRYLWDSDYFLEKYLLPSEPDEASPGSSEEIS
jgi:glycosyltransferase involved in cell wall biosynthesis